MNERFKTSYTWEDIEPIRPLFFTVIAAQLVGAVLAVALRGTADLFGTVWLGAALATLPGFFVGLFVQYFVGPAAFSGHRKMVLFLGAIAAVLTLVAVFGPLP